jgi:hypothetical protein
MSAAAALKILEKNSSLRNEYCSWHTRGCKKQIHILRHRFEHFLTGAKTQ